MSLVNATTTPRLLRLVESGMLDIGSLVTHRMSHLNLIWPSPKRCTDLQQDFPCAEAVTAYDTFKAASQHQALKVAIDFD